MTQQDAFATEALHGLIDLLDIPESYYEKAKDRYRSLGEWFERPESTIRQFKPRVCSQGSFRYGTVIRPLIETETYDLDLVCNLALSRENESQEGLKAKVVARRQTNHHVHQRLRLQVRRAMGPNSQVAKKRPKLAISDQR